MRHPKASVEEGRPAPFERSEASGPMTGESLPAAATDRGRRRGRGSMRRDEALGKPIGHVARSELMMNRQAHDQVR
jgi:hypothetical protein